MTPKHAPQRARASTPGLDRVPTIGALTGVVAPLLFVLTFTVDGALRPGYDPFSMFVSELSLGPGGWVQRVNFLISGTLIAIFSSALSRAVRGGRGGRAAPLSLAVLGVCLALSGLFNTDPSAVLNQVTPEGTVHGILGAVVFTSMPISCFVLARRLKGLPDAGPFRRWTIAVGIALVVLIVVQKISQMPSAPLWPWRGLVQRQLLILYMTWLLTSAVRLLRRRRPTWAPPPRR